MTKTENFNLNQWEPHDEIKREDFNADNAAVDAALKNLNTAVGSKAEQSAVNKVATDLAGLIVVGTYTATSNGSTATSEQTITLGFQPRFLLVRDTTYKGSSSSDPTWSALNLGIATPAYIHYTYGSEAALQITETGFIANSSFGYKNRTYVYLAVR